MVPVSEPKSAGDPDAITVLPDPTLDVSIVVPYYNPGDRLRTTVEHMVRVLDASGMTFEIIAVSDGSTDGSPFTLEGFPESVVRRMEFARNIGKGHALRAGLGLGRGRYLGFIDADGDISPEFLAPFVSIMQTEEPDIIIGSKRHPESSVHYPPLRRLYSWGYQHLIHLLFRLNVKDTQVGIKLVDRRVIADVLPLLRESRFALDLELLVLARRLGYTKIVEAPVRIRRAVRQHDLAQGRVAPPRRHPGPLRPLLHPPRVRRRTGRPGGSGRRRPSGPRLNRAAGTPLPGSRAARDERSYTPGNEPVQAHLNGRRTEDQVPHDPTAIRNVALVGHHGAGKTTLAEALLAATGAIARRGSVEKGSTVMDFEPEEVARQLSISTSLAPFTVNGVKVNLLDTPGYADFAGEMVTALANVDLAVVVVSATDGVQAQTEDAWRAAARLGRAAGHRHQQARPRAGRLRPHAGRDPCLLRRRRGAGRTAHRSRGRLPRRDRPARRHGHPLRRRRPEAPSTAPCRRRATRGRSPRTWSTRSTRCTSSSSRASWWATTT